MIIKHFIIWHFFLLYSLSGNILFNHFNNFLQKYGYEAEPLLFSIKYFILVLPVYFITGRIVSNFFQGYKRVYITDFIIFFSWAFGIHGLKKVTFKFLLYFSSVFGIFFTLLGTILMFIKYKPVLDLLVFLIFTISLSLIYFTYSLFTGFCILGVHKLFTRHKENKTES